jgi:hypothetical protein
MPILVVLCRRRAFSYGDRRLFIPLLAADAALAHAFALLHHGRLNGYIAYAPATLRAAAVLVYVW